MYVIYLCFFIDGSTKATYDRILRMIQRSVKEANRIYNMAEFYGKGRTIHKGIRFELTDFYIDTDLNCNPPPEKHGYLYRTRISHNMQYDRKCVLLIFFCLVRIKYLLQL